MSHAHRSFPLAVVTLPLLLLACDRVENRVPPERGYNTDRVEYKKPPNPGAPRVPVPTVEIADSTADVEPMVLPALAEQPTDMPLVFHGELRGVPGGPVVVYFYRKKRTPQGKRVIANSGLGTARSTEAGGPARYEFQVNTPRETGQFEVEIVAAWPVPVAKVAGPDGELQQSLKSHVIATTEITVFPRPQ